MAPDMIDFTAKIVEALLPEAENDSPPVQFSVLPDDTPKTVRIILNGEEWDLRPIHLLDGQISYADLVALAGYDYISTRPEVMYVHKQDSDILPREGEIGPGQYVTVSEGMVVYVVITDRS